MKSGNESTIEYQIGRSNRNFLISNLILLVLLILVAWSASRYYYNFFWGPFNISREELVSIDSPQSRQEYFVVVQGDTVIDSGYSKVEQTINHFADKVQSQQTVGLYQLLFVNHRLLIVYTKGPSTEISYSGSLETIPSDLRTTLVKEIRSEDSVITLPYMLNATSFRNDGYLGLFILLPTVMIVLWNLRKVIRRSIDHSVHPIYKSLERHGDARQIAGSIDNEFRAQLHLVELMKCSLTENWLIVPHFLTSEFVPLSQILWIFNEKIKHSIDFIPIFSTYKAVVITYSGERIEIGSRESTVNKILSTIQERIPWVAFGFSERFNKLFRKDHRLLIAEVERQREESNAQTKKA